MTFPTPGRLLEGALASLALKADRSQVDRVTDLCCLCGQPILSAAAAVTLTGASSPPLRCHESCRTEAGTSQTPRNFADATKALLAAIVESSDDAIVSKTLDGIITSWNRGAQRLFGYTADEAIGRSIIMLIPADRRSEEEMILSRLRRGDRLDHYETVRVTKDGRHIDVSVTISPLRNEAGAVIGASKVARDIGAQKRTERQLQEADARKNEFLALLAHELRNPLGPIRHAVKVLRARAPSPEELEWATSIIDRQTTHMTRLVEDLLDVSRITRGRIELRRERVDLATTLKAAVESSSALIERPRHKLRITPPTEPLYVEGDPVRLTQVVSNLLNNAAKYSDPGSHIWLSAEREGDVAVIRVKDTGIGISREMLPRIFDMFTQAGMPMDRGQGGLGVGLALVDQLVRMHGGTVSAASDGPGQGSEFTVRLPVAQQPRAPAVAPPDSLPQPSLARCRVLVVDDNQDSVESLAMLLQMTGHEVQTANDGEGAVALADEFRPDVAILDIGLPKVNGYELAKRIRERPWAKDIVLIALTGWGQEEHRKRSAQSGFNHHLTKPVEFDVLQQLLTAVDACLPERNVGAR